MAGNTHDSNRGHLVQRAAHVTTQQLHYLQRSHTPPVYSHHLSGIGEILMADYLISTAQCDVMVTKPDDETGVIIRVCRLVKIEARKTTSHPGYEALMGLFLPVSPVLSCEEIPQSL